MDADAEALTCRSAQRMLFWEKNSRPRAAESLPGSPANLQAARAINAPLMVGQNAHSAKVVGFRIYSSQPASTAPFCRCTFLSGLIPTTAIRKFIPARNAASRSSVRGRYLGDALELYRRSRLTFLHETIGFRNGPRFTLLAITFARWSAPVRTLTRQRARSRCPG